MEIAVLILVFLVTVTFHEVAHGFVANALGDPTAKREGRLTLNPLKHIDILWTILFPLMLIKLGLPAIGMAKPVPVDFGNLHRPKRDMIWVALAGPAINLFLAWGLSWLFLYTGWWGWLVGVYFNLGLAVFNLLPIPPLDGSRILTGLLPLRLAREYVKIERVGFIIVIALVWMGWLWRIIFPVMNFFCRVLGIPPIGH